MKGRVTIIKNFLDSFVADDHSFSNLQSRLQKLEECWSEFNFDQTDIQDEDAVTSDEEIFYI